MKFKTKEDLSKILEENTGREHRVIINGIVNEVFESLAERVEDYKRYKSNYKKFLIDNPSVKVPINISTHYPTSQFLTIWRDWLFDYYFRDVIDDK